MKNRPTRTPFEELRRHSMSMVPGTMDGRISEARPILNATSENRESPDDEASVEGTPQVQFWQDRLIVTAAGTQTLKLTYLPLDHSEHLYWGRLYQRSAFWSRRSGSNLITIQDPNNDLEIGDVLTVKYAYTDPSPQRLDFVDEVSADGPILWASHGEIGGSMVHDRSGFDRHGLYGGNYTLGQPPVSAGLPGTSVAFSAPGWAEFAPGASWQRSVPFTAEVWIALTSGQYLMCCDDAGSLDPDRIWDLTTETSARIFYGSSEIDASAANISSGFIGQIAMTFSGTKIILYLNGEVVATQSASVSMNTSTVFPLTIGCTANGQFGRHGGITGRMQHSLLFNKALPPERIKTHYEAGIQE